MARYVRSIAIAGSLMMCGLAVDVPAQTPADQKAKPTVRSVPTASIVSVEGRDNYNAYCAVCHGPKAKGDGPAAPAMKAPVADLTTIAKRNNGKFNAIDLERIIRGTGKTQTPAHGVEEMPIWGEVFRFDDRGVTTLRIANLVKYIESLQVK